MTDSGGRTVDELAAENVDKFMEDGPRLRSDYNTWIEARDPRGFVLLGGLGGMGIGTMWVEETDRVKAYPGYLEAPEVTRTCGAYPPARPGSGDFRVCRLPWGHVDAHRVDPLAAVEWHRPGNEAMNN